MDTYAEIFKLSRALARGTHGSFMACLGEALAVADTTNAASLIEAFRADFERVLAFEKSLEDVTF